MEAGSGADPPPNPPPGGGRSGAGRGPGPGPRATSPESPRRRGGGGPPQARARRRGLPAGGGPGEGGAAREAGVTHHQLDGLVLDHRVGLHSGGQLRRGAPPAPAASPRPPGPAAARPPAPPLPHGRTHARSVLRNVTASGRGEAPPPHCPLRNRPQLPAAPAAPRRHWLPAAPSVPRCLRGGCWERREASPAPPCLGATPPPPPGPAQGPQRAQGWLRGPTEPGARRPASPA